MLEKEKLSIREVAGLVGLMVAYSPAVEYGGAYIKALEMDKNRALVENKGNFDALMAISEAARRDICWWLQVGLLSKREINFKAPEVEMFTDGSMEGWGAHWGEVAVGGRWDVNEIEHINVLELKAIQLGLDRLCPQGVGRVKVWTDNTTALAYVRKKGGVKSGACNQVAKDIWEWCESRQVKLSIAHVPGDHNVLADFKSRNFSDNVEWELNGKIFTRICKVFGKPEVDLFASATNHKVDKFVSWSPVPGAWQIDAFSFVWTDAFYYVFPPFSVVGRVVQKLEADGTRAVLVVPRWPSQPWYGRLVGKNLRQLDFHKKRNNLWNPGNPDNQESVGSAPLGAFLFWPLNC